MAAGTIESRVPLAHGAFPAAAFSSGLRNIRHAIELQLKDSGIERQALGDTSEGCNRPVPGMVIFDVGANGRIARVTFTRDEVEDCSERVATYCVKSKINHLVDELLARS
jgi:hypothetical protein